MNRDETLAAPAIDGGVSAGTEEGEVTTTGSDVRSRGVPLVSRSAVEDFLYDEADLLDRWRLEDWLKLFELGATYHIPSTDMPDGNPETSLFLVADDWFLIQARVKRLSSKNAHVENPHSRTRRIVGNVRVRPGDAPGTVSVKAAFTVYRVRNEITDLFVGQYDHVLAVDDDGQLRFRHRKAVLDLDSLPAGKVSVIL